MTLFPDGAERYPGQGIFQTVPLTIFQRGQRPMGFSTDCIHAGNEPDPATGAVSVPDLPDLDLRAGGARQAQGLRVRAHAEPDARARSRRTWRSSRGGAGARAFASGMAAITAISTFVKQGDHVVCSNMTYGGTYRYYTKIQARYGVEFSFVDTADADGGRARDPARDTKLLHLESPTNPTMTLCDIALLSGARARARRDRRRRQHVRARRTSRSRSRSAPTSSCTRRRSS